MVDILVVLGRQFSASFQVSVDLNQVSWFWVEFLLFFIKQLHWAPLAHHELIWCWDHWVANFFSSSEGEGKVSNKANQNKARNEEIGGELYD
jgi:hypothetical protein